MTPRRLLVVGAHSADFVGDEGVQRLAELMREYAPDIILTHPKLDPFNPDHPVAHEAVTRGRLLSSGNHARKVTGDQQIRQAEAFQRLLPNVVEAM